MPRPSGAVTAARRASIEARTDPEDKASRMQRRRDS